MNSISIASPVGVACYVPIRGRNNATPRPMFDATPRATATQQRNTVNARLIETMIPRNGHATGNATPLQNPHATPKGRNEPMTPMQREQSTRRATPRPLPGLGSPGR